MKNCQKISLCSILLLIYTSILFAPHQPRKLKALRKQAHALYDTQRRHVEPPSYVEIEPSEFDWIGDLSQTKPKPKPLEFNWADEPCELWEPDPLREQEERDRKQQALQIQQHKTKKLVGLAHEIKRVRAVAIEYSSLESAVRMRCLQQKYDLLYQSLLSSSDRTELLAAENSPIEAVDCLPCVSQESVSQLTVQQRLASGLSPGKLIPVPRTVKLCSDLDPENQHVGFARLHADMIRLLLHCMKTKQSTLNFDQGFCLVGYNGETLRPVLTEEAEMLDYQFYHITTEFTDGFTLFLSYDEEARKWFCEIK